VTGATSLAKESIVIRRSADGSARDRWELGLKQCSFHHTIQILQVCDFCAFSSPPALPPCYCSLRLSTLGEAADLRDSPSIPWLLGSDTALVITTHTPLAEMAPVVALLRPPHGPLFADRAFALRHAHLLSSSMSQRHQTAPDDSTVQIRHARACQVRPARGDLAGEPGNASAQPC